MCQRCKHWQCEAVSRRLSIFRDAFWMLMTHEALAGNPATLLLEGWGHVLMDAEVCRAEIFTEQDSAWDRF